MIQLTNTELSVLKNTYVYRNKYHIDATDPSKSDRISAAESLIVKKLIKEGKPTQIPAFKIYERVFVITKLGKDTIERNEYIVKSDISGLLKI